MKREMDLIFVNNEYILFIFLIKSKWGLGIGDWGLGPIPNPQSPIPNPQSPKQNFIFYLIK